MATAARGEAEERAKATELQQRLDRFETIYGAEAIKSASLEVQQLCEQLQRKEEELRRVQLELKASLEVRAFCQGREISSKYSKEPSMLCTEVERMSALWENLDKQLKSKIFDLSSMEEKLNKSLTEVRNLPSKHEKC